MNNYDQLTWQEKIYVNVVAAFDTLALLIKHRFNVEEALEGSEMRRRETEAKKQKLIGALYGSKK